MYLRKAEIGDAKELTKVALEAKKSLGYPDEYFDIWKDELTITTKYVEENIIFVMIYSGNIIGFYSIVNVPENFTAGKVEVEKGFWLDHIFILPEFQRKGIGKSFIDHAVRKAKGLKIDNLQIFADPKSAKFYDRIGAEYVKHSPSSIEGRDIPVYRLKLTHRWLSN